MPLRQNYRHRARSLLWLITKMTLWQALNPVPPPIYQSGKKHQNLHLTIALRPGSKSRLRFQNRRKKLTNAPEINFENRAESNSSLSKIAAIEPDGPETNAPAKAQSKTKVDEMAALPNPVKTAETETGTKIVRDQPDSQKDGDGQRNLINNDFRSKPAKKSGASSR